MKVIVVGCLGQMGQPVSRFVAEREGMELVGGMGPAGRDYIGRDLGQVVGLGRDLGIPVADDLSSVIDACDALIDVSSVEQCLETLDLAVAHGKALVTASTGFSPEQFERFEAAGRHIPIIFKCNTSKMVNVMLKLVEIAARALVDETDIEIIDQHDRDKLDAPSGTAVIIGNMIAELKGTIRCAPAISRATTRCTSEAWASVWRSPTTPTATTASPAAPWTAPRISKESPRAFTALKTCSTCVSVPPAF